MGHVDHFQNYVSDLKKFISEVVKSERQGGPLFLLAHSMGGAIASLYLEDSKTAKDFQAAALVTPMHQPWADSGEADIQKRTAKDWCKHALALPLQIPKISREEVAPTIETVG